MHGKYLIEHVGTPVKRPSQPPDTTGFPFFQQKVQHTVIHVASPEIPDTAPDRMQQVVVYIIHLQILERLPVHSKRIFPAVIGKIGQLGGNEQLLPGVAFQGDAGRFLRPPLNIYRRGVEIVHAVSNGVIHQFVYGILVDKLLLLIPPFLQR